MQVHRYLHCSAYVIKKQIDEDRMTGSVARMWGMWNVYTYIVGACKVRTS